MRGEQEVAAGLQHSQHLARDQQAVFMRHHADAITAEHRQVDGAAGHGLQPARIGVHQLHAGEAPPAGFAFPAPTNADPLFALPRVDDLALHVSAVRASHGSVRCPSFFN